MSRSCVASASRAVVSEASSACAASKRLVHGVDLLEDRDQLDLEPARLLLQQLDLALRQPELLVVADARDPHPAVLHLGLARGQPPLEIALAGGECCQLALDGRDGRFVGVHRLLERRDPALARLQRLRVLAQALVDALQCGESLDLCSQGVASTPLLVCLVVFAAARHDGGPSVTRTHDPPVMSRQL